MTDAFQCERCGEYQEGSGTAARAGRYLPEQSGLTSTYEFGLEVELCDDCYDMFKVAISAFMANGKSDEQAADEFGDDIYTQQALERGRPAEPCECVQCDCALHSYADSELCVWCEHDDHSLSVSEHDILLESLRNWLQSKRREVHNQNTTIGDMSTLEGREFGQLAAYNSCLERIHDYRARRPVNSPICYEGGEQTIEFDEGAILAYLDCCIEFWRQSDKDHAEFYVDAYQSVRLSIFGECLPETENTDTPQEDC